MKWYFSIAIFIASIAQAESQTLIGSYQLIKQNTDKCSEEIIIVGSLEGDKNDHIQLLAGKWSREFSNNLNVRALDGQSGGIGYFREGGILNNTSATRISSVTGSALMNWALPYRGSEGMKLLLNSKGNQLLIKHWDTHYGVGQRHKCVYRRIGLQ